MYRFAWFRGFEASDADTQTSSGRGAAPSPFKRWFGEAAVQPYDTLLLEGCVANHTSLAETVSALTTELLNGFRNEDSDEVEYKSVTYNPIDLGKRLLKSKDDDRKLALPTFSTFFAALLETLTFGEGSANCLSHALVRDGLDLVELGVYEYGAAGLGFDPRDPLDLDDRDDAT
ncbi:patatin-like phospholipase [Aureococcus anophagefferens]|nr:patatin-like phospholipase [Aureococcus anophagefferens]